MITEELKPFVVKTHPTGSSYICNPPVLDTDRDLVVLAKEGFEDGLSQYSYGQSDIEYDSLGQFVSVRRGDDNLIITTSEDFYNKFVVATEAAKSLNLTNKKDRVKLFQVVLYNNG